MKTLHQLIIISGMTTGDLVELPGTDATRAFVRARARAGAGARACRCARGGGVRAHAATACTPWRRGWRALSHRARTENGRMADELAHRTQKGYGRPRVPLALRSRAPTRLTRALACAAMALADGVYAPAAGVAGLVAPRAHREWEDGGGACASHSQRVLPPSRPPGAALARTDASTSVRATALAPSAAGVRRLQQ